MITRKDRVTQFRKQVHSAWTRKWWSWLMKYEHIFTDDIDTWQRISRHPYTTLEIIDSNPEKPWQWDEISENPNLTLSYILANMARPWDWINISRNPAITSDDVIAHPELPWNWRAISNNTNPSFTMAFYEANLDKDKQLCWVGLSYHPQLTLDFVKAHIDKPWHWPDISQNPAISLSDITENPELPWDWGQIAYNPNVTEEFIPVIEKHFNNPEILWHRLSHNDNISSDFIYANMDKPWSWSILIKYHKFTQEDILGRFWDKFDFYEDYAMQNENYTIRELTHVYPEFNDSIYAQAHPLSTFERSDSFEHNHLSVYNMLHLFTYEYTLHMQTEYRRYLAAYRIQQWWLRLRLDPRHPVGQRRLEREYTALFGPEAL